MQSNTYTDKWLRYLEFLFSHRTAAAGPVIQFSYTTPTPANPMPEPFLLFFDLTEAIFYGFRTPEYISSRDVFLFLESVLPTS